MKKLLFLSLTVVFFYPAYSVAVQDAGPSESDIPVSVDATFAVGISSFVTRMDVAILQKVGCKYSIDDSATASQMLELLNSARNYSQNSVDPKFRFEVRNLIVFHFRHKKDVSVVFEKKTSDRPYVNAVWDAQPILLRSEVEEQVRGLVSRGGFAQINKNVPLPYCDVL